MRLRHESESVRGFTEMALSMAFNPDMPIALHALYVELLEKCKEIDDVSILYMIRLGAENRRLADGYPKATTDMWNKLYTDISDLILQRVLEKGGLDAEAE